MRPWVRGGVAVVASLATLTVAVQVLVVEPTTDAASRAARVSAAREAALTAAIVRAGGVPRDGAELLPATTRPRQGGGTALVGDGRAVWVPERVSAQLAADLRARVLLLGASAVIAVTGWALWAGSIRRRDAERMARLQVETIGMVAHDLRSPLTGIALAADRLAGDGVPAARVAARAAIDRECARLLATAEDILSVCCDTAAHSDDDVGESISDVLEDVAARVRDAHGCAVIVDADLATRRLSADRGLARAVANVAENAARHSPPGCAVRFVAAVDDDTIELAIEDGGNGFDPAFRVSPFRRGVRGGRAGLGLASTRMIVERLGGSLRIGDRLGGGASVSLRVPRRGVPQ